MGANKQNNRLNLKRKLLAVAVTSCFSMPVYSAPSGASVASGSASITTTGSTMTVTNTPNAIINWAHFGIDAGETVRFVQQSSASAVLNRVTGSNPSAILGTLQSNGKVFLINPNGIMFGAGAVIDVNGFVASTLNMTDADFLNGRLRFNADRLAPGAVTNAGEIKTPTGGFVYLLAPNVENSGVITTPSGEAILAAGNSIEIVNSTDPSQRVQVSATSQDVNLSQLMTQSNGNIFSVLNSGRVSANTVVQDATGKIYFRSAGNVTTTATSLVEAKGDVSANGGSFIGFADQQGIYRGHFDTSGSNGGFIETSAAMLDFTGVTGTAAALGPDGVAGTWLFDPDDLTIDAAAASTISSILLNTNVSLTTSAYGGCTGPAGICTAGNGDIIFSNAQITRAAGAGSSNTLSVTAYGDIVFDNSSIVNDNTSYGLSVVLNAGSGQISSQGVLSLGGAGNLVIAVPNAEVWDNTGILNMTGKAQIDLDVGSGLSTFNNNGVVNISLSGANQYPFFSNSANQDGIFNNYSTFINSGNYQALEVMFSNYGSVVLESGGSLSIQNGDMLSGQFYIGSGTSLAISEAHAGLREFNGATIFNDGTLSFLVGVNFNNSALMTSGDLTIPLTNVVYGGFDTFIAGGSIFLSGATAEFSDASGVFMFAGGSINISSSTVNPVTWIDINAMGGVNISGGSFLTSGDSIGIYSNSNPLAVEAYLDTIANPSVITAADVFNIMTISDPVADVTINNSFVSAPHVHIAARDVKLSGSSISATDAMVVAAKRDFILDVGSSAWANLDMLVVAGNSITLNDFSSISVSSANSLTFGFPYLASGGWFVDGVEGVFGSYSTGSWIEVGFATPVLGAGFYTIYGGLDFVSSLLALINDQGALTYTLDEALYSSEAPTVEDFFGTPPADEEEKTEQPQQCSA